MAAGGGACAARMRPEMAGQGAGRPCDSQPGRDPESVTESNSKAGSNSGHAAMPARPSGHFPDPCHYASAGLHFFVDDIYQHYSG